MGKKYLFRMALSSQEVEEFIRKSGKENGLYVKNFCGQLIIRKPKLLFGMMPLNFQVSFIVRFYENEGGTIILGKFDAPRLFYQICISLYLLLSFLSLTTALKNGLLLQTLIQILFMGIFGLVLLKGYIGVSKILFAEQNKVVLEFFRKITS